MTCKEFIKDEERRGKKSCDRRGLSNISSKEKRLLAHLT